MVIPRIAILLLIVSQVLSAPTGCLESCSSYVKHYQTQTSGNLQQHGDLTQAASHLQSLDYSRPGTWSEHNNYNVDNGHEKVHEERGQIVEGPKTVNYYNKNYSSSYSTRYSGGTGLSEIERQNNNYGHSLHVPNTEQALNSQRMYTSQIAAPKSITEQHRHNTIHSHAMQSSIRRTNTQSERLEDLGEHDGNSQVVHGESNLNTQISQVPYYTSTNPANWSKVDSYKTDGGHGRVFEEEGQFVSGPKKVRYYKRNYTSSYSTSGGIPIPEVSGIPIPEVSGIPIPEVGAIGVHNIHKEIEQLHKEMGKELSHMSSNIGQTNTNTYGLTSDNLQRINTNTYRNRINSGSSTHRDEEHFKDTASEYVPHTNPSLNTYGANSYSMYERHEGRVTNRHPTGQYINPTPGYTNVVSTGNSGYSNTYNERLRQQQTSNIDQAEVLRHQTEHIQNQLMEESLRRNIHNTHSATYSSTPGRVAHYKEHWSSSGTKEMTAPQYSQDISQIGEQSAQYNSHHYENQHNTQQTLQDNSFMQQYRQNSFNSDHQRRHGKLGTGTLDLGQGEDTVDCAYGTAEHSHTSSRYQTKYKRSVNQDKFSDMQQHSDFDGLTQQAPKYFNLGQHSQHSYEPWTPHTSNHHLEDLTQQTGEFDDLTQQTSEKLEFGQQHPYQPQKPRPGNQHLEDLTQQTGEFDDLIQQTSGKLEFGEQHSHQPQKPRPGNQHLEDLTQQTGEFDDLTQQTSGKLEFGQQHSYQHQKPRPGSQHLEDLTQQTGEFDDLTQQTSGKLEFGQQHSHQPQKPRPGNQHLEDLTQQTGEFDDLTQQTSGKLEFGQQHSHQPQKPRPGNQHLEDLTQQTGEFDDLTQQTSGKLEFGQQHSHQPQKPRPGNQHLEDLTQQTGEFDDLTQQTSGKLEFGQQHSHQPQKPRPGNQHLENLTQQTGEFDDLTQQTSGKLEFGQQHSHQPQKPRPGNQHLEDLTQQTGEFDDLTQQTSGKVEFGQQHSYQPQKPRPGNQQFEDLTQQTDEFDDLTQQTSGKLEFGQQHSYQPREPRPSSQHLEDLTQQTGEFDDLTQQTSGKVEFGQQHSHQPQKPRPGNQHLEDLTQQTGEFDDLTQQTSGNVEFGQQHSHQPQKPRPGNQHLEDLTQQTGEFDDVTQQTSGKVEFGQQHSYQPQRPRPDNQHFEDLTQQTGEFDDLTQQTSGKLEFGQQHSYQPQKPRPGNQHLEDLTQQTGEFGDLTQQTSGKLEFGQQHSYQPQKPSSGNQHLEGLTQQMGEFDDLTQQTSGKFEFGQHSESPYNLAKPGGVGQFNQQYNEGTPVQGTGTATQFPKPAEKPKPKSRYSRVGTLNNLHVLNQVTDNIASQQSHEIPPKVLPEIEVGNNRRQNIRGDQGPRNPASADIPKDLNEGFELDIGGGHDQKHIQQINQKDRNNLQQQSSHLDISESQTNMNQQHMLEDLYQQSSNQYNGESDLSQQPQKYGYDQETEFGKKVSDDIQKQDQLEFNQQTVGEIKGQQVQDTDKLEPRILEAYGGGPYDASHSDDIYNGVRVNPSATLPPILDADPWDIREKPREMTILPYEATPPPMPVKPLSTDIQDTTRPPSFWSRVSNRITNTFDKARERARTIFG
ncbi:uncharacterized protein LOC143185794 [Calliopsis andreniformis]|uniref:uncharacterized protein LOC143185794 n=1 Tax=Calliopsis andreniformis TaxID=337506 RepID=UPI003FCCA509